MVLSTEVYSVLQRKGVWTRMQESWILGAQIHLANFPKGPLHLLIPSPGIFFLSHSFQYLPHFTQVSLILRFWDYYYPGPTLSKVTLISLSLLLCSFYFTSLPLFLPVIISYIYLLSTVFVLFCFVFFVRMWAKSTEPLLCSLLCC